MLAARRCAGPTGPQRNRSTIQNQPQHPHSLGSSSTCRRPLALTRRMRVSVAAAASPAELQQLLAAKERELAAMFESGRPMPQASVVAALRSEIAALDAQMNGLPIPEVLPMPANATRPSRGPGSFSPGLAGPGSFGGQVGSRPPGSGPPPGAVRSRTEQLADKAYEMVEQQMRANQGMGQEDDMEIARLEHENTQLRAQAYELLQRQQQLESMLAEVRGQKEPELLLESAETLLARMKAKLQKA